MSTSSIPYEKYWVHTKDGSMGHVTVYEGIIVEVSEPLVRLLGREWVRVLPELRDHLRNK